MKATFKMAVFLLGAALIATLAHAGGGQKIVLEPGPSGKGASGAVVVKDTGQGQKEIAITAKGLKPGPVYTVVMRRPSSFSGPPARCA